MLINWSSVPAKVRTIFLQHDIKTAARCGAAVFISVPVTVISRR